MSIPAEDLKTLLLYSEEITDKKAQSLMKVKQILAFNKNFQYFEDNTFMVSSPRRDWILLCYMYIIENTTSSLISTNLDAFVLFATGWLRSRKDIDSIRKKLDIDYKEMYRIYTANISTFNFFNVNKFVAISAEFDIHSWVDKDKLIMQWNDIEIASVKNEILYYPKIILMLRIPDFYIERYIVHSHKFSYDSEWDLCPIIHPNLNDADMLRYGRNNYIEFLPAKEYRMVIEIFDSLIRGAGGFTFESFSSCKETYDKLSIFWESIDVSKPIEERNKLLFEKLKGSNNEGLI
jgi:hypothetical protein